MSLAAALFLTLIPVPPLTGPVVDLAGMLDGPGRARLEQLARAARAEKGGTGVQLQFLTVPTLGDEPIEDFSIRVAEAWKIGSKGADNGLLFTVAQAERRFRIEVGGGLEGDLTDTQTRRILDEVLKPAFRDGDYASGLYRSALAALNAVHGLPAGLAAGAPVLEDSPPAAVPRHVPVGLLGALLLLFTHGLGGLVLFLLLIVVLIVFSRGGFWGGGFGGGYGGGGGFGGGGGGWSGGGGGFSGGGASGGW